jgi:hypothetical protein
MAVPPANPPVLPFQQKGASFIPFFHSQPALIEERAQLRADQADVDWLAAKLEQAQRL